MSLIGKFKEDPAKSTFGVVLAVAAIGGLTAMAVRQNQIQKQITELQKVAELNATVTLNLVNTVGRMSVRQENPIT
ncbi:hypothetical protein CRX22_11035 [Salmonella enterica subsp. enterica serovar Newport]|jgi:hypothetical protein|nr:hypothetical protein [Salmonella enterica subsp. enterica serovar Newport]